MGVILVCLDSAFIAMNYNAYADQVATIQRTVMIVNPVGLVLAYLFLIGGLYFFIVRKRRPIDEAFIYGIVLYGVYDSTNYAMIKKWSPSLASIDTLWGGTLMAVTTAATYTVLGLTPMKM